MKYVGSGFMSVTKRSIVALVFILVTYISLAQGIGIAIIFNENTAKVKGPEYVDMIHKAEKLFADNFIPALVIDADEVEDDILDYYNVAVLLSDSDIETVTVQKLKEFLGKGGRIVATYDTAIGSLVGVEKEEAKTTTSTLSITLDNNNQLISNKALFVKPTSDAQVIFWHGTDLAAVLRTDNTLYIAEEIFNKAENSLWEQYFLDNIYEMLDIEQSMFAIDLPDIKTMYEVVNLRFTAVQKIYRKYEKDNKSNDEISHLYNEALFNRNATRYYIKKEACAQATYFLSKAKKATESLFPLIHPLHKTVEELTKRGDHWFKRVNIFSTERVTQNAVLFIGDSITEGFYLQGYMPNVPTINRGISADFASGVVDRLELLNLDSKPRAALLMIGTNNITCTHELDKYIADVTTVMKYLQINAPQAKLYIQTILPLGKEWSVAPKVREYNEKLAKLASELGVGFLDIYSLLQENDYLPASLSGDGVHLNGTGYQIWTNFLLKTFKQDGLI